MNILARIVENKKKELVFFKSRYPEDILRPMAQKINLRPDFLQSLRSVPMGLIAEVKRRSPSAGAIRENFDPAQIARAYEVAGAQAISVLMDEKFFGGGAEDFRIVREAVALPLLYKEFVIDPWQVWHAASLGASAVLLIAAVLDDQSIASLAACCREAGLEPLVEVHDEKEMRRVVALGMRCIGVNNRDLRTFKVSIETTLRLKELAPKECTLIGESGIRSAEDVARLKAGGVHAILVGEHLLRQADVEQAVRKLMSGI